MALLLAVSSVAGVMLERFRQQVDETLGTTSQKVVSTGGGHPVDRIHAAAGAAQRGWHPEHPRHDSALH